MSEEKTYGQIGYESTNKSEWAWDELITSEQQRQEQEAQAVIAEFLRRNGEPIAWKWIENDGIGGSPITKYSDIPPGRIVDAIPLYVVPQPLPSVETIAKTIHSAIYPNANWSESRPECAENLLQAEAIIKLLKEKR